MYTSLNDLTTAGVAMLSSTVLPPATTRRWFNSVSHTSDILGSVGAPREIVRDISSDPNGRVVNWYTKEGDIGTYAAKLHLSPDYNAGFGILAAQDEGMPQVSLIADAVAQAFLPALEVAARTQATAAYVGTYSSPDTSLNSSLSLASDGLPGLLITAWDSNGTDQLLTLAQPNKLPTVSPRIYLPNVGNATNVVFCIV